MSHGFASCVIAHYFLLTGCHNSAGVGVHVLAYAQLLFCADEWLLGVTTSVTQLQVHCPSARLLFSQNNELAAAQTLLGMQLPREHL